MSGAGRRRLRPAPFRHLPDAGPVASPRCSTPDAGPAPGGTNRRHSGGQALSCPSCPHEAGTIEPMSSQPPSRPSHSSPEGLLQRLVEVIRIAISYFSSEGPPSSVPGPAPRGVNDDHHGHRTFLYAVVAVVAVVVVLVVLGAIVYLWVNGYLSAEVKFGILIGAVILLMIIMFLFGDEIGEYLFKLLLRLLTLPFVLLFRAGRGIWRALNRRSSRQATGYGQSPQTGYGQATSYGQAQSATQTGPPRHRRSPQHHSSWRTRASRHAAGHALAHRLRHPVSSRHPAHAHHLRAGHWLRAESADRLRPARGHGLRHPAPLWSDRLRDPHARGTARSPSGLVAPSRPSRQRQDGHADRAAREPAGYTPFSRAISTVLTSNKYRSRDE